MEAYKKSMMLLNELAKKANYAISPFALELYGKELSKFGWEKVSIALERLFFKTKGFPTVAEIEAEMGIIAPDAKDEAVAIAGNIMAAIPRYGWARAKEAAEHLGTAGWAVVERMGGWMHLCESASDDNAVALRAQMREMAKSVMAFSSQGRLEEKIALREAPDEKVLDIAPDFEKLAGEIANKNAIKPS